MSEFDIDKVKRLPEWITASQAATILKISRQHVNRLMQEGEFRSLRALGDRPILVVKDAEIRDYAKRRLKEREARVRPGRWG
jgi:predicted DNA-binding transcriptional regulator AlpA